MVKFFKGMFTKNNQRNIDNLFTGVGLSRKGKGVALAGLTATTAVKLADHEDYTRERNVENVVEMQKDVPVESLPSTYGDGQDYMSRLRDMQAQGDLVFALNNLRGGRF